MGKNKWYFETENSNRQPGSTTPNNGQARTKKTGFMPSTFVLESPENMPLPKLMQLVWLRFRRSWVALRFQTNRWSFGLLKWKTLLQLGVLAGVGIILLGPDGSSGMLTKDQDQHSEYEESSYSEAPLEVETSLELGSEVAKPKKAPSIRKKNEAAPVGSEELLRRQSLDYIARFHKIAREEMDKYGIPASISLAQGLIESRAGTSKLAVSNNNHFGMKCFDRKCKKGHCSNFTDDTHKDFFRKFSNPWASWRAHSQLLASGRYAKLKRYGRNYRDWAYGLKAIGYATDRTYAEKLIGIIERYDLDKYDR